MNLQEKENIINLHLEAFGEKEGELIAKLVRSFLEMEDTISISIKKEGKEAANVIFTPFVFTEHPDTKCYLLAPLAVLPKYQGSGMTRELMKNAINHLTSIGAEVVFVLGVPDFYPKFGFEITDKETPYPHLLSYKESWMALEIIKGSLKKLSGKTKAVEPFMQPFLWDTSEWG